MEEIGMMGVVVVGLAGRAMIVEVVRSEEVGMSWKDCQDSVREVVG